MASPLLPGATYPTLEELRDLGLSVLAFRAASYGLDINVLPGSEPHFRFTALASIVAPAYANNRLAVKALNPIDADDPELSELCTVHGVPERKAAPSTGKVIVKVVSGSVTIPAGFVGTLSDGTQVQTLSSSLVFDGDTVDVEATKGGAATNKAAGAKLTWDDASIAFLRQQ